MSPSCSSVTALHWQRYIGTLDPAKVCGLHCDTGIQVFASLQCTHLPKRISIGTRIPPHNRVSRQYRDGPDTRLGPASALSLARIDCVSASSHTPYRAYRRRYQHQSGDVSTSVSVRVSRLTTAYRDSIAMALIRALAPHQRCLLHVSIACLRRLTHRIVRISAGTAQVSASERGYHIFDVSGFCILMYRLHLGSILDRADTTVSMYRDFVSLRIGDHL